MTAPTDVVETAALLAQLEERRARDAPEESPQTPEEAGDEAAEQAVTKLLSELLNTDDLDNIPPLEPVVDGVLFRDTVARLYGPSGTFKSFLTLDIAACVATATPWHGRATFPGPVVYLVAEGSRGIRKRVRAWEQHHGRKMTGVKFLPRPVQAREQEWFVLTEACRRMRPALVIVDTQARVTVGVEENSNTDMGLFVDRLERLRAACGACLLLVHHTGHDEGRSRGATAVLGALQTELGVTRKNEDTGAVITLKNPKQKDDDEFEDLMFGVHQVRLDGEAKEDGSPVTSVVLVKLDTVGQDQARTSYGGKIAEIAAKLDDAGVPMNYGRDRLRGECQRLGIPAKTKLLEDVARHRKNGTKVAEYLPPEDPEND